MLNALDVRYKVIIEVEICECREVIWDADLGYLVLTEAEFLYRTARQSVSIEAHIMCTVPMQMRNVVRKVEGGEGGTWRRVNLSSLSARKEEIREWTRSIS